MKQEIINTKSHTLVNKMKVVLFWIMSKLMNNSEQILKSQHKLPTMYWLPKLHKNPYKARFIANSSSCTTTKLSTLLTSCLTKIKEHVKFYCDKTYENSGINLFGLLKTLLRS